MKTFCSILVIMLALCLCLAILAGVSYLDAYGPDWIAARGSTVVQENGTTVKNPGGTPFITVVGAMLSLVAVIGSATAVLFDIQKETKP